jgi:hypothetical protein
MVLQSVGITIFEHTDARATHPPPAGVRGFIHRSWSAGKDENFYTGLREETSLATWRRQLRHDYRTVALRIRQRSESLGPTRRAAVLGWLLGWTYYGIKSAGYLAALWHRDLPQTTQRSTA